MIRRYEHAHENYILLVKDDEFRFLHGTNTDLNPNDQWDLAFGIDVLRSMLAEAERIERRRKSQ